MRKNLKVSVVMPTYNEKGNIRDLAEEVIDKLTNDGYAEEIIIVDDNSPDGTWEAVQELEKRHDSVKGILRTTERGLGTAIKRGINESSGDVIVLMDCDFSHPPEIIPIMLNELENADAVFASRYVRNGSMNTNRVQYYLSKLFNHLMKAFLGIQVLDSTNGFFVIRRNAIDGLNQDKIFTGYGEYCFKLLYTLRPRNLRVKEIPFSYMRRRHGTSKTKLLKIGFSYSVEACKLRFAR